MINHDITRNFNHDKEATGKHVKAEILSIVASQDHILNPASAMDFAKYSKGRLYVLDNDGGHQAVGNEMETVRFRDSKSKRPSRRKNHWT